MTRKASDWILLIGFVVLTGIGVVTVFGDSIRQLFASPGTAMGTTGLRGER